MLGWPPKHCLSCGGRLSAVMIGDRRRPRCRRCGWIFYGNPVPAVAAVIVRGGRVLLTLRGRPPYRGTWDLPGGFIEADETPEAALARELREELDIRRFRRGRLIGFFSDRYGRGGLPIISIVYRVTPERGQMKPGDDVAEVRWFPLTNLPYRQIAFRSMRVALRTWAGEKARGSAD